MLYSKLFENKMMLIRYMTVFKQFRKPPQLVKNQTAVWLKIVFLFNNYSPMAR